MKKKRKKKVGVARGFGVVSIRFGVGGFVAHARPGSKSDCWKMIFLYTYFVSSPTVAVGAAATTAAMSMHSACLYLYIYRVSSLRTGRVALTTCYGDRDSFRSSLIIRRTRAYTVAGDEQRMRKRIRPRTEGRRGRRSFRGVVAEGARSSTLRHGGSIVDLGGILF